MRWLALLILLTSCAPVYYGSIVWDVETTLACREQCEEVSPLSPDIENRAVLYGYSALWAAALTVATERLKKKHKKIAYAVATTMRLFIGTLNLRYVKY